MRDAIATVVSYSTLKKWQGIWLPIALKCFENNLFSLIAALKTMKIF